VVFVLLAGASACGRACGAPPSRVPVLAATYVGQRSMPPTAEAERVAFSPDGSLLAVASSAAWYGAPPGRGWVTFYRAPTWQEVRPAIALHGTVATLRFCPDGRCAIVGMLGSGVRSVRLALQGTTVGAPELLDRDYGNPFTFSPDGSTVAMVRRVDMTPQLLLFDAHGGPPLTDLSALLRTLQPPAYETPSGREGMDVAFSPDGALLAFSRSDGARGLVRIADGTLVRSLGERVHGRPESLSFSPDGTSLASSSPTRLLQVWDVRDGRQRVSVPVPRMGSVHRTKIVFDAPGARVFVLGPEGTVFALAPATGAVLGALGAVPSPGELPPGAQADLAYGARDLDISRDGRWLAYADGLRGLRILRLR